MTYTASPRSHHAPLLKWWARLDELRGDRAELRRAHSSADVVLTPAYHRLRHALLETEGAAWLANDHEKLAAITRVLPHVREHVTSPGHVAAIFGARSESGKAQLSEARFLKLLRCQEPEDLIPLLLRALPIIGHKAPVLQLADDLIRWDADRRRRWAECYYDVAPLE